MKKRFLALPTVLAVAALLLAPVQAAAQTAPDLGVAAQFGALGGAGVTGSTGLGTDVAGDVGSSPTASVTNFPPSEVLPGFTLHLTNDAVVQQARQDTNQAWADIVTDNPGGTVIGPELDGEILSPGIYTFAAQANLAALGTLELNDPTGTGVYIFLVNTALTANVGSTVIGSANPCNVYWRTGTFATLNGVNFYGTVLAGSAITLGDGANAEGRLLAGTESVTMAGNGGNTVGGCSAVIPPGNPVPSLGFLGMAILIALIAAAGVFANKLFA